MKERFKQALDKLRSKVTWLAQNNKLSNPQLKDYNFILQTFTEYFNYSENRIAMAEDNEQNVNMELSQILEKMEKLKAIIQLSGITKVFIDKAMKIELHYLKNEVELMNQTQNWLQSEWQIYAFHQNYRIYKSQIQADIETVKEYEWYVNYKEANPNVNTNILEESYRLNFPHLSLYFNHIEAEKKLSPIYEPHLYNALDNRYLWKN